MAEHLLKRFDDELNKLRFRLIKMGTLVQNQIELAMGALNTNNADHARLVLDVENKIDKLDLKIDKQCIRIFALHQPVAMDLRLVLSALSMNDDMETIGDYTSNIAKDILRMNIPPGLIEKTKLPEMGKMLESIISKLIDSFVNMSKELSIEAIMTYEEINNLYDESFVIITNLIKSDTDLIEVGSYLIDINRNIHSISRQVRSIAQELVFLVEARLIKHLTIEEIIADIDAGTE